MRHVLGFGILLLATGLGGCATAVPASQPVKDALEYRMLINSNAKEVASLVREFVQVAIDADMRTNILIIQGRADQVALAVDMANHLESIAICEPNSVMFMRRLKNAKALDITALLELMTERGFFGSDIDVPYANIPPRPQFVADPRLNAVLVSAGRENEERIRALIDELDSPVTAPPQSQPELHLDQGRLTPRPAE